MCSQHPDDSSGYLRLSSIIRLSCSLESEMLLINEIDFQCKIIKLNVLTVIYTRFKYDYSCTGGIKIVQSEWDGMPSEARLELGEWLFICNEIKVFNSVYIIQKCASKRSEFYLKNKNWNETQIPCSVSEHFYFWSFFYDFCSSFGSFYLKSYFWKYLEIYSALLSVALIRIFFCQLFISFTLNSKLNKSNDYSE